MGLGGSWRKAAWEVVLGGDRGGGLLGGYEAHCPCPACRLFPHENPVMHPGDITCQAVRAAEARCCKLYLQGSVC